MKICENNEREVQGNEGLGDASRRKGKVERERRGESKGEHGPGVPMMEVEEEREKRERREREPSKKRGRIGSWWRKG
jgi:hypothetical protein